MTDKSKRYWNERTKQWECGNDGSKNYQKPAKDQSGKPGTWEKIVSRLIFGGPEEDD